MCFWCETVELLLDPVKIHFRGFKTQFRGVFRGVLMRVRFVFHEF